MSKRASNDISDVLVELQNGIKEVYESNRYKEFLNYISKFHKYSINNVMWLKIQNPFASQVASFKSWNSLGRKIIKGEKSLKVLAPIVYKKNVEVELLDKYGNSIKDKDGNAITKKEVQEYLRFKAVPVFDISQTEGKEIPKITKQLMGNLENFNEIKEALEKISKVPIEYGNIAGSANGYYDYGQKKIMIQSDMEQSQTIKTLIHEIAHSRLHTEGIRDRDKGEIEAESVAYVVSNSIGLDSSEYSFGYVASWSRDKELEKLKESLDLIQKESHKFINEIDSEIEKLLVINKEKEEKNIFIDKFNEYVNGEVDSKLRYKEPFVVIRMSESINFKKGEVITLKEANERFANEESKIRELKEEYSKNDEYYPYSKTRFELYISKDNPYTMRYDIGDGTSRDLIDLCKEELGYYKNNSIEYIEKILENKDCINNKEEKESILNKLERIKNNSKQEKETKNIREKRC